MEKTFEQKVIDNLEKNYPGAIVIKGASQFIQGFPDRVLLAPGGFWAALEFKAARNSPHQPNQDYYVDRLRELSYASFIFPENERNVLNELQRAFRLSGTTRLSFRK